MEQKSYEKPIKKLLLLLGLLIFSPLMLSIGFKAQRIYTESPGVYLSYLVIGLGIGFVFYTVYFGFKTVKSFLDILFEK